MVRSPCLLASTVWLVRPLMGIRLRWKVKWYYTYVLLDLWEQQDRETESHFEDMDYYVNLG